MRRGTQVYINCLCQMTKMADMPIYGYTFRNRILQNLKSYDLETWHAALGTQTLQSLYKLWPSIDLDLIYGKCRPVYE